MMEDIEIDTTSKPVKNAYAEPYTLTQFRDNNSGVLVREEFRNAEGNLDRGGLASQIEYDLKTGQANFFTHHQNGVVHREDGPARYLIDPETDIVRMESWFKDGKPHRDGGLPACIFRSVKDGSEISSGYYEHGVEMHPDDSQSNSNITNLDL